MEPRTLASRTGRGRSRPCRARSASTVRVVTPGWRRISEKKSPGARSAKRKERRETPASRRRLWRRRRAAYFMRWLRGPAREECPHEWGQQPGRLRYGAGGGGSSPGSFERQGGGDQFTGMGVAGLAHQGVGGRILDDGATLHDGDLVGQAGDQREVMGNQDIGDSQALLETAEKGGDLGGERGIEAVEGLVEDDQLGLGHDGAGDGEALALSAAEFVGAFAQGGARDAGQFQGGCGAPAAHGGGVAALDDERLLHNFGGGEARVEAGGGLLEDELNIEPAPRREGTAREEDLTGGGGFELRQATGERAFAGARGADYGQSAGPVQGEADSREGGGGRTGRPKPAALEIGFGEIADAQQRVTGHKLLRWLGCRRGARGAGRRWWRGCRGGGRSGETTCRIDRAGGGRGRRVPARGGHPGK